MPILIHLSEKHILTIQKLQKLQVVCFMFKVDKGFIPPYFSSVFCINDVHSYNTRFATKYHITVHRTSLLHHTIHIAGPILWNSLDSNIKSVTSLNTFRRRLKNLLLSQLDS